MSRHSNELKKCIEKYMTFVLSENPDEDEYISFIRSNGGVSIDDGYCKGMNIDYVKNSYRIPLSQDKLFIKFLFYYCVVLYRDDIESTIPRWGSNYPKVYPDDSPLVKQLVCSASHFDYGQYHDPIVYWITKMIMNIHTHELDQEKTLLLKKWIPGFTENVLNVFMNFEEISLSNIEYFIIKHPIVKLHTKFIQINRGKNMYSEYLKILYNLCKRDFGGGLHSLLYVLYYNGILYKYNAGTAEEFIGANTIVSSFPYFIIGGFVFDGKNNNIDIDDISSLNPLAFRGNYNIQRAGSAPWRF